MRSLDLRRHRICARLRLSLPLLALLVVLACGSSGSESSEAVSELGAAPSVVLGDAAMQLLPTAIRADAEDPSTFTVDSAVAALLVQALVEGRSGLEIELHKDGDGSTQGYRLSGIQADSAFALAGLKNGDLVRSVNGILMTSEARAREALASGRRQVVVAIERGDSAIFLDYRLIDGLVWAETVSKIGGQAVDTGAPAPAVVDAASLVAAVDDDVLAALAEESRQGGSKEIPVSRGTRGASGSGGSGVASKGVGSRGSGQSGSVGKGATSKGSSGASCSAADECTVRRSEIDALLADPHRASRQLRYMPHIRGGRHRGYRLLSVTPGSAVADLGFRKGDVITGVNGYNLSDDGDLFALYMELSTTSSYRITYTRAGTQRVKRVRIR